MTSRSLRRPALCAALSALLVACTHVPEPEPEADTRLDEVVVKLDRSLAGQALVEEQLRAQQRQLEAQQENLLSLSQDLGRALQEPVPHSCPEVKACPARVTDSGKVIVGALEKIWLSDLEIPVTARMDTGTQTSVLNARNIETFERDGNPWVRFEIIDPRNNQPLPVERKLRRTVAVGGSGADIPQRRPVVKLGVVIGDADQTAEFILREKDLESYQALIGRNILNDVMLVDVSRKNIAPYTLPERSSAEAGVAR